MLTRSAAFSTDTTRTVMAEDWVSAPSEVARPPTERRASPQRTSGASLPLLQVC